MRVNIVERLATQIIASIAGFERRAGRRHEPHHTGHDEDVRPFQRVSGKWDLDTLQGFCFSPRAKLLRSSVRRAREYQGPIGHLSDES